MTPALAPPTVRIVVCGNAERGDDGLAMAAIASVLPTLAKRLLARLEVRRCEALRVEDLEDVPSGVDCLILDAVAGVEPGTVVRLPLVELADHLTFTPRSSHELPIDLVLGLAGVLRDEPVSGTFLGLAGHGFGFGTPLSRVVRAAMPAYREAIEAELFALAFHDPMVTGGAA
jgi:hydrogenase maturation protease